MCRPDSQPIAWKQGKLSRQFYWELMINKKRSGRNITSLHKELWPKILKWRHQNKLIFLQFFLLPRAMFFTPTHAVRNSRRNWSQLNIYKIDVCGSVRHSTIHTEKSKKMQHFIKIDYSIFIWSSTCFGRHTAHHQEPKTALAASGFAYVEGCLDVWLLYAVSVQQLHVQTTFHVCKTRGC